MKTATHAQQVKLQIANTKEQIQQVLGWSNQEYCHFQYKMGYLFLELELEGNCQAIQKIAETRSFWAWWINHWSKRDKEHLNSEFKDVVIVYEEKNNPNTALFNSINPQISLSYCQMIHRLVKTEISHV